ncbi:UNVERIFIED_CONTAM: hypothetical protein K2H54_026020 [Gekko kuhli]
MLGYLFEDDDLMWDHLLAFGEGVKSLEQGDLPNTTHLQQHPLDHMEVSEGENVAPCFPPSSATHLLEQEQAKRGDATEQVLEAFKMQQKTQGPFFGWAIGPV